MKHIYFIRHGESVLNQQGLFSGQTDTPLSDTGYKQAQEAGKAAKDLHIDHIISSPLSRAYDTAKCIARETDYPEEGIELNSLLIERSFGSMEGKPWSPDFNLNGVSDVETVDSLQNRVRLAWEYIQTIPADNILVVSHGSTGRMLRNSINPDMPFTNPEPEHRFDNAKIVQLI